MASRRDPDWESARAGVFRPKQTSIINRKHARSFVYANGAAVVVWWHLVHMRHPVPLSRWIEFSFLLGAVLELLNLAWPRERPPRVNAAALAARRGGMLVGFYLVHRWVRQGTHRRRHES